MSKQFVLAVSESAKSFFETLCGKHQNAVGKTGKEVPLTIREAVDAVVSYAQAKDTDGNSIHEAGIDTEVSNVLALRVSTARANSLASKLEAKDKELAELRAQLEAMQKAKAAKAGK